MQTTLRLTVIILLLVGSNLSAATHYVSPGSTNPTPPYATWATAATNIQDAVDAAATNDEVVVTNGVYPGGLGVNTPLALVSVNGPQFTVINGGGPCVSLTDGASLTGFTLTNGYSAGGGGVSCASTNAFLTNCVIVGNTVFAGTYTEGFGAGVSGGTLCNCTLTGNGFLIGYDSVGGYGGGASGSTLYNCTLTGNSTSNGEGGGAILCTLYNCTLSGNSADLGGGAYNCTLYNCTLSGNSGDGADGSTLYNCTLTGNSAPGSEGGGAYGCTLNNCTLSGNSAPTDEYGDGGYGGGAFYCTLYNCTLTSNSATEGGGADDGSTLYNCMLSGNSANYGGGAWGSTLYNCTLTGNSAYDGGGAGGCTLYNCILYYNTVSLAGANYDSYGYSTLTNCCTTPLPTNGVGNITNAALFVDYTNGNLRLQSNSPCINAGNNAYVTTATDLDGNPRIVGGTVDMGAYEYQTPVSMISYAWLQQYGLPITTNIDTSDLDGTGMDVYQDWIAGLNPTNPASVLVMNAPTNGTPGLVVTWQSVNTRTYYLQGSTNLAAKPAFSTIQSNLVGQTGTTSFTDTTATNSGPYFYRVGVQ